MRSVALNALVLAAWGTLHGNVVAWLIERWSAAEGPLHLTLAAVLLGAVLTQVNVARVHERSMQPPTWRLAPLAGAGLPPLLAALAQRVWPLDVLGAVALVASAYGLVGLYVAPPTWRRLRAAAGLGAAVLPLTGYLDVLLGFPLRAATASMVASLLEPAEVTATTVLAVDGALAHVDLPCSGVQSLWSGAVVLLGAAVAWGRAVDVRFFGLLALVSGLIVVANTGRVLVLVALDHVLGLPLAAEIAHVPLGVVGFVAAVGAGLAALHHVEPPAPGAEAARAPRSWTPVPVLIGLWLLAGFVPDAEPPARPSPVAITLPQGLDRHPVDARETAFAADHGARILKATIDRDGVQGSVVVVVSGDWLAHHVPTWCLETAGWAIEGEHPVHLDGRLARWASAHREGATASATWWFQGAHLTTDDHTRRILAGLGSDAPWALVSLLLDETDPANPAVADLVSDLHLTVDALLEAS